MIADCRRCGRSYSGKSFNDIVWNTKDWGCKRQIEEGKETTKEEKHEA